MNTGFQVETIEAATVKLWANSGNYERIIADRSGAWPCRLSLEDAKPGEEVWLANYRHLDHNTPYDGSGPVFVCPQRMPVKSEPNEIPSFFLNRGLSLCMYDRSHHLIVVQVTEGRSAEVAISELFAQKEGQYILAHFAAAGCFACRILRSSHD